MAGLVYDREENARLQSAINAQNKQLENIDNSKELTDKKMLKYAIILGGAIVFLVVFKMINSKK